MTLELCHPRLPTCTDCQKYRYDDDWNLKKRRRGRVGLQVIEEPELRLAGDIPPCAKCPKIPSGAVPLPENAVVLSPENRAAFFYWRLCSQDPNDRDFPRDALTRENNALIQGRIDSIDRRYAADANEILLMLAKVQQ